VSVGHTVYSTVVTTGILSDPGVSHPEFVSREVFDGALKAIETMFRSELSALRKGKSVAEEPEPTPTPPSTIPPPRQEAELSADEMRQLLTATLLSRTDLREDEVNLLGYLQRSANLPLVSRPETATSTDLQEVVSRLEGKIDQSVEKIEKKIDDLKKSVSSALGTLETRVRALETTCRTEAEPSKRRRDDEDDPSRREEEASK
jgi:hypothetical protein